VIEVECPGNDRDEADKMNILTDILLHKLISLPPRLFVLCLFKE